MPTRFVSPPRGPVDLNWFGPLLRFAVRCRDDGQRCPVHLDEFRYRGRIVRDNRRATLHAYEHVTGGALVVDEGGNPYRSIPTGRGGVGLRFLPQRSLGAAIWCAGIAQTSELLYEPREGRVRQL